MVAVVAERVQEHSAPEHSAPEHRAPEHSAPEHRASEHRAEIVRFPNVRPSPRIAFVGADDHRAAPRREAALKCWLMDDEECARGYALDVSKDGARLCGVGSRFLEGQRLVCKLLLDPREPPLVLRCKVVRAGGGEVGVRFLELGFDEWYRLGRFASGGAARVRAGDVLSPPA